MRRRLSRLLVLAALSVCASCSHSEVPVVAVSVLDRSDQLLSDWAMIRHAVQLNIPPEVAIGRIGSVLTDTSSGDVLVADLSATKTVYRFGSDGSFRRAYAAQSTPRRVQPELLDVTLLADGSLVMAGNLRLRRYASDGRLTRDVEVSSGTVDVFAHDSSLYMLTTAAFRRPGQIVRYSIDLSERGSFGEPEDRLRAWNFFPSHNYIAALGEHLFAQRLYEPVLMEYDEDGTAVRRFDMPSRKDEATSDMWRSGTRLSREDKTRILRRLHVLKVLLAVGAKLAFLEIHEASGLEAVVLLDPGTGRATRIPGAALLQHRATVEPGKCTFPEILGGDGRSLVALIDDPQLFAACRAEFEDLRRFDAGVVERPIVVYVEPRV